MFLKQILSFSIFFFSTCATIAAAPSAPDTFVRPISQDTLPETTDLFASLEKYYSQKLQAELAEFNVSEKKRWMKYLPNVGLGYNLTTTNEGQLTSKLRPTLSYSTNIIYAGLQHKETRQAKVKSITETNRLELAVERRELEGMIKNYQYELQDLDFMQKMGALDEQLFEIATAAYDAAEIPPSAYLPKKRAFMKTQYEIFKKTQGIAALRQEIFIKARVLMKVDK